MTVSETASCATEDRQPDGDERQRESSVDDNRELPERAVASLVRDQHREKKEQGEDEHGESRERKRVSVPAAH